jgi:hypothetical protein
MLTPQKLRKTEQGKKTPKKRLIRVQAANANGA